MAQQPVSGLLAFIGLEVGAGGVLDAEADQVTAAVADELRR
jgi:hypothetical protein